MYLLETLPDQDFHFIFEQNLFRTWVLNGKGWISSLFKTDPTEEMGCGLSDPLVVGKLKWNVCNCHVKMLLKVLKYLSC